MKKYISWNVNGLRAVLSKGDFDTFFREADADAFCIQETKLQEGQVQLDLPGYEQYWDYAEKKGYSGTAIFTKTTPVSVTTGLPGQEHSREGRCVCLEFKDHYLLTVYVPNSRNELTRLPYRMEWEDMWRKYVTGLAKKKPVIFCGDLNVAHQCIDLKNDRTNHKNAGFTDEERAKMTELLASGFTDSFRYLYPEREAYSWWSYRMNARAKNAGWRIDYFIVSDEIRDRIREAYIYDSVYGSDHCPVGLLIDVE